MAKKAERWLLFMARDVLLEIVEADNECAKRMGCKMRLFETEIILLLQAKLLDKSCPVNGRARKVFTAFCATVRPHYAEQEWQQALLLVEDHFVQTKTRRSWK